MARNILFIMCDQLRADYLGCGGHPHLETPVIDGLARRGVRDFIFVNVISDAEMRAPGFRPRAFVGTLIHQLLEAQIENGLEPLRYGFPELGIRAFVLRPSKPLRVSVFKFDREECRRAFDLGMKDAEAWFDNPGTTQIL